jgi:acetylornithine deacetylase/succinyl-diaminopimelate desuccinylase-like protein
VFPVTVAFMCFEMAVGAASRFTGFPIITVLVERIKSGWPSNVCMSSQLEQIYGAIDRNIGEHVGRILRLISQPSIAAQNIGMRECADLVRRSFLEAGCGRAEVYDTPGQPVVYGELDCGAPVTLGVYMMYDVKQVEGQKWTLVEDPFKPRVVEMAPFGRVIVGRGAVNSKGPMQAFLNAVSEAVKVTGGRLPVNLRFIAEGEEEISSPNLYGFVSSHKELFEDCDAMIMPFAAQDTRGEVSLHLGCKGVFEFELECSGEHWGRGPTRSEIHSSYAPIVESPVWRLIRALGTMKADPEDPERVTIQGFYDDVVGPSQDEMDMLRTLAARLDFEAIKQSLGVKVFRGGVAEGVDALVKLLYEPTLNIQGIYGGYTGPGFMTILPYRARVKLEVRLVPNMDAAQVLGKVRRHLDSAGYSDVKVVATDDDFGTKVGEKWAKVDPKAPIVGAAVETYRAFGYDPQMWPRLAGTAPIHVFTNPPLSLPLVIFGLGHGGRAHAPDEYYVLDDVGKIKGLAGAEKSFVSLLYAAAKAYAK